MKSLEYNGVIDRSPQFSVGFLQTTASSDSNSREWSAPVRKRMKDIFRMATRRKWRWDYIPAITIAYLRSVRLLDSIMLYLMGSTASRVWYDIRGRVNIYPVRFLKCPDLQWPLCCPPHIYCRALPTAIRIHFCLAAPRVTSFPLPASASKDSSARIACPECTFSKKA